MKVERAVVDTNVLISALLISSGTPRRLLNILVEQHTALLFSDDTFNELVTRISRRKFDRYRTPAQMADFLDWLAELGEWVSPDVSIDACRDDDDNKFLSLAISGQADCLITGDNDLLVLHPFPGVQIFSPAELISRLVASS